MLRVRARWNVKMLSVVSSSVQFPFRKVHSVSDFIKVYDFEYLTTSKLYVLEKPFGVPSGQILALNYICTPFEAKNLVC